MEMIKGKSHELSLSRIASLACLLEVSAAKPGNVHRGADFEDLTFCDFVVSAELLGQALDRRRPRELGKLIFDAVSATAALVGTNTNLGIALLICPLVLAADSGMLNSASVGKVLKRCTPKDSDLIYQAIRLARPSGLGTVEELDISGAAPAKILSAMALAADRDMIARQYTNNFEQVFDDVVPLLVAGQSQFESIDRAIVYAHVSMIARYGDSLIGRKLGQAASDHARFLARRALEQLLEDSMETYYSAVGELDFWMRSDGHRRNPGTTADMLAAGIFAAIVNEHISAPFA
jgi:triphosphoribosyl-dephospho-CoA synthase